MRCFVYGAGEYPATTPIPDSRDLVIAADGGLNALGRAGREADVIVGDFDSLGYTPGGDRVVTLPEKRILRIWRQGSGWALIGVQMPS